MDIDLKKERRTCSGKSGIWDIKRPSGKPEGLDIMWCAIRDSNPGHPD
jgi:hypothetical protein